MRRDISKALCAGGARARVASASRKVTCLRGNHASGELPHMTSGALENECPHGKVTGSKKRRRDSGHSSSSNTSASGSLLAAAMQARPRRRARPRRDPATEAATEWRVEAASAGRGRRAWTSVAPRSRNLVWRQQMSSDVWQAGKDSNATGLRWGVRKRYSPCALTASLRTPFCVQQFPQRNC